MNHRWRNARDQAAEYLIWKYTIIQRQDMSFVGQLGFQLMDSPEEIIVVEKVVTFDINDGQKTFGQEAYDIEPGLLTVSEADVACNQGNSLLVSRQRRYHHLQNAWDIVGLLKLG